MKTYNTQSTKLTALMQVGTIADITDTPEGKDWASYYGYGHPKKRLYQFTPNEKGENQDFDTVRQDTDIKTFINNMFEVFCIIYDKAV